MEKVILIVDIGVMSLTKRMEWGAYYSAMAHTMRGIGKMASSRDKEECIIPAEMFMKASGQLVKSMALVHPDALINLHILVIGTKERSQVRE